MKPLSGATVTEAETGRQVSPFLKALAREFGGLSTAETCVRDARTIGLTRASARGPRKVWTVDEIAAIVATFMLVHASGSRSRGLDLLHDPVQRRSVLNRIGTAMQLGAPVEFEFEHGLMVVNLRMSGDAMLRLGELVGDWRSHASPAPLRAIP